VLLSTQNWYFAPLLLLLFSDISPSDRSMALGVNSAPSENEYQEHSWG
jgi:hypothetical protein